jgi:hypothetical protein
MFNKAIAVNEQVIFHDEADRHSIGLAYLRLGIIYDRLGDPRKALNLYKHSLHIQHQLSNIFNQGAN